MTKLPFIFLISTTVCCSCSNQTATNKNKETSPIHKGNTTKYNGLRGTWVRYNNAGFTRIEIRDTSNVLYYQFLDRKADLGKPTSDGFWYYKSRATMGYWDSSAIWIGTDKFRFDYKIKADTLIEFDKMGDQGTFIKVQTNQEKAFKDFNAADVKGDITL